MSKIKTLVFVGGWARVAKTYNKFLSSRPGNFQVLIVSYYDLIENRNNLCMEDGLLRFMDNHSLDRVYLAGHSLGGEPCIRLAGKYPERVEALFLIDSCGALDKFTVFRLLKRFITTQAAYGIHKLKEDVVAFGQFCKRPILYMRLVKHFYTLDLESQAKDISTPTIILWGDRDYLVSRQQTEKLKKYITSSRLLILKDADHDWIIHSPKYFWKNFQV